MARAELLDEERDDKVENTVEAPEEIQEEPDQEKETTDDLIPEKYQGKSVKELVEMHQNAEQALGKQSSEVGELRKVVDDFINAQLTTQQAPVEETEEVDFFVDPERAVAKAIEQHPKIKEAEALTQKFQKESALTRLKERHPDMNTILKDSSFVDWIKASTIRQQLFVKADQEYDYEAADELFSYWKERKGVVTETAKAEKEARKSQVKAASTGNTRAAPQGTRKKIYRRSDLIKLMRDDPERYQALGDEIMQAYREKRVR